VETTAKTATLGVAVFRGGCCGCHAESRRAGIEASRRESVAVNPQSEIRPSTMLRALRLSKGNPQFSFPRNPFDLASQCR
jgi:hypothetical protein